MPSEIYRLRDKKAQVKALKKLGYDGWLEDMDSGWGEISAFYSEQVKSATDNLGTFSKYDPDIRYSRKTRKKYVNPYENWHGVDNEGHFVSGNENGGSDASEQAFYWVARENVVD